MIPLGWLVLPWATLALGSAPVTLSGVVRYADGRAVPNCRVVVLHPAFEPLRESRCDSDGRYRLELDPAIYNAIAILDEGYGKSTLEFWAWNVRVTDHRSLDATIGTLEVYRPGGPSLTGSFQAATLKARIRLT